jgi:hypothetical protein
MGGGIEGELKTNRLWILPIPLPTDIDIKNKIEIIIDELLLKMKRKENIDTLDKQIEELVCKLYGLSDSEIQFISSSVNL